VEEARKAAAAVPSEETIRLADEAAARLLAEMEAEEQASVVSAGSSGSKKKKKENKSKNKSKKGRAQRGGGGGGSGDGDSKAEETNDIMPDVPVAALEGLSITEETTTTITAATATAQAPDKDDDNDEEAFQDFLNDSAPDSLKCPITQCLFREPIMALDGHMYEKEKLEEWIATRQQKGLPLTSPRTGALMQVGPMDVICFSIRTLVVEQIDSQTKKWKETGEGKKKG
jgi:hypothetical protein